MSLPAPCASTTTVSAGAPSGSVTIPDTWPSATSKWRARCSITTPCRPTPRRARRAQTTPRGPRDERRSPRPGQLHAGRDRDLHALEQSAELGGEHGTLRIGLVLEVDEDVLPTGGRV